MTLSEAWVDGLAGWASGAMVVAFVQPIDTVLTRSQASLSTTNPMMIHPQPQAGSSSLSYYQLYRQLTHRFGISSLWRGSAPMIYAVPAQNALLMGGYGVGKQWSCSDGNGSDGDSPSINSLWTIFIAGSVGGVAQSFLMSPVELIKVQQQVHVTTTGSATFLQSSSTVMNHWQRGLTATLLRDGIPHGVWFASYEWSKQQLLYHCQQTLGYDENHSMNQAGVPMAAGAFAATVAWVCK